MILGLVMAGFMAAAPSALETARDQQNRAALEKMVNESSVAAAKAPNDADAQYRVALAASYLAEVAIEPARPEAGTPGGRTGNQGGREGHLAQARSRVLPRAGHSLRPGDHRRPQRPSYGHAPGMPSTRPSKKRPNPRPSTWPRSRQLLSAFAVGRRLETGHRRFPKGHRARSPECGSIPVAGAQPPQGEPGRRGAPGLRQVARTDPNRIWAKEQLDKTPVK